MIQKIKLLFSRWLKSYEESQMARVKTMMANYGYKYRRWE